MHQIFGCTDIRRMRKSILNPLKMLFVASRFADLHVNAISGIPWR
jgi:hypothetical protein